MGYVTGALVHCSAQMIDPVAALFALAVQTMVAPVNSAMSVKDPVNIEKIRSACWYLRYSITFIVMFFSLLL
jgi:hypothetical protein